MCLSSKTNYLSIHGPAGTGKTETFKDFSRLTGRRNYVFSCSDMMTSDSIISKCTKELMSRGFTVCFDEYNRCVEGVWEKADKYFVGTSDLRKKSSSFVMMTANPGYAGRHNAKTSADSSESVNKSLAYILDKTEKVNYAILQIIRVSLANEGIKSYKCLANKLSNFIF